MASTMRVTIIPSPFQKIRSPTKQFCVRNHWGQVVTGKNTTSTMGLLNNDGQQHSMFTSLHNRGGGNLIKPIYAAGRGLEASIENPQVSFIQKKRKNDQEVPAAPVNMDNANIVLESTDNNKMQLRVDITGDETKAIFKQVLINLIPVAPSIPGFGRRNRGKSTEVPLNDIIEAYGQDQVADIAIRDMVRSTIAQYVKKENLKVKDSKINTAQSEEELRTSFVPGNQFGFTAILELE